MSDFEMGGPLHLYLESKFEPLVEQVTKTNSRLAVLEANDLTKRVRSLELWRSYLTGAVATIGGLVALGGRAFLASFFPPAGMK